uniref:Phosphofructokinase domain-containing protein n=1 Tax=Lotharella oceanica TaxID=641309 RepID=A0A7S2TY59_9EUKA
MKELQNAVTTRQVPLRKPEFQKLLSPSDLKVSDIKTLKCDHIKDYIPDLEYRANHPERARIVNVPRCYNRFTEDDEFIILDLIRKGGTGTKGVGLVRAGARSAVPWRRGEVNAAIVTCGGLCPGLNVVINQIVETLYYNYGVNNIYGIKWGFRGIWNNKEPWLRLTPDSVLGIHELGGTILGSSRGGFNLPKMVDALLDKNVNQLYVIGGDGTHRGARAIYLEGKRRKAKLAVACVPKTIDNDVGIIDHSFGFHTAVEKAVDAIRSSVVEASCIPNGIGVVKLMGREAGFIAAHAVLSSRRVDLCLVPEVPVELDGEDGVLNYLYRTTKKQGYAVVVVAEGAGVSMMKSTQKRDESGNIRLPSIGAFLKKKINAYFESKGEKANIKYHDPSYMIRSVPANAADSVMCNILAENAVHGAMAGYTGFTSGLVNNRSVYIPIPAITATSPVRLNPFGRTWERVCNDTQQPHKVKRCN